MFVLPFVICVLVVVLAWVSSLWLLCLSLLVSWT